MNLFPQLRRKSPCLAFTIIAAFHTSSAQGTISTNGLITTVSTGPDWKTTSPAPPAGWNTNPNFNDSSWIVPDTGSTSKVIWYGAIEDVNAPDQAWFRYTFNLASPLASATASIYFDDWGEAYVNGTLIKSHSTDGAATFNLTLDPSLFIVGKNLIAVHGINVFAPYNSINETYTLTAVPEPASILLLAIGTLPLLVRKHKHRST